MVVVKRPRTRGYGIMAITSDLQSEDPVSITGSSTKQEFINVLSSSTHGDRQPCIKNKTNSTGLNLSSTILSSRGVHWGFET